MRLFRVDKGASIFSCHESGVTLLNTLLALAILGAVAVTFLSGLASVSKAAFINDKRTTAESLAQSQMEWVKNASYSYNATGYSPAPMPGSKDYINYSAVIDAESLHDPDEGIQQITVVIRYSGEGVTRLEGYKVDR